MLQRDRQLRTQIHQLTDACVFGTSFWLSFFVRANVGFVTLFNHSLGTWFPFMHMEIIGDDTFENVLWLYFALIPAAPLVLESQGFYNRPMLTARTAMFWPLFKGCCILTIGLVLLLFFNKESNTAPRGTMVLFGVIGFGLVWAKEELLRIALRSRMARSQYKRRIILAGTLSEIARLRRMVAEQAANSIEVAAEFNLPESTAPQLIELLHEHSVSGVMVSARHIQIERVENVIHLCETEGVEAWLVADIFATQIARASFDEMFGSPLLVFRTTPETSWQMLAKLLLDFFGALTLVILAALPMFIIALLVKWTSRGPVFFRQQRSGLNGQPFEIFKFRTMVTNAEQFKHELAAMNEMTGPVFKVTNDPRVTPLGRFLRKWSLDELPQLFNILRGDMSLVGPRPLPVDEVRRFNDLAHRRRLSVKPGLTCLWQVSGRNKISDFKEWVRLDLEYIDNWSIWLDIAILIRTIPAVFSTSGAK
ncbi:MAG TPA: sugar transferase [Candidatus Sulfotelmatobacter sp.]|jgi:exopolysaccharide biosynthesis polyprenyl glycosylphosphotransferase|nr:sugar transferase [Candidatus Sulfotelmatobacter sp.]